MNQLKRLLLTSTIVPALALAPIVNSFAQDSEPGTHQGHKAGGMERKSHGDHKGSHDESAGNESHKGDKPSPHENSRAEKSRTPESHAGSDSADSAPKSDRATPKTAAESPSSTSNRRDASDTETHPNRAQRKAAKHGGDDTNTSAAKSDDRGTRNRTEAPATARDTNGTSPGASTPSTNTARDSNRMSPDNAMAPKHGAPDTNTARDNNRTPSDNAAARDNNRTAPDRNDARDAARGNGTNNPTATGNATNDNHMRNGDNRVGDRNMGDRNGGGMSPAGAAAIGAAAGFAGGFIAATGAQRLDDIRRDRREVVEDGRTYIREPGRTIVEDGDRRFVVHDENERFRDLGYNVQRERRGRDYVDIVDRPGGIQIVTYTDADGRMLRRVRRDRDGHEFVLIDNGVNGGIRPYRDDIVDLPPPPMRLPRDRYVVDYRNADETLLYDTLTAPPLAAPPQRYSLDQIRYSPDVRNYVRSVDINTINFDTASWTVPGEATGKLRALAGAINRAVDRNPNSVFLVEGYTDAVGNPTDNLSLSDRRAQSVAAILTKDFNVPPENLTTQGYGQQNLKVNTSGPSVENRRVVVRNITQLIASGNQPVPQE